MEYEIAQPHRKIDLKVLHEHLRNGGSQAEFARKIGVSSSAVSQACRKLSVNVVKSNTLEHANKITSEAVDTLQQLRLSSNGTSYLSNCLVDSIVSKVHLFGHFSNRELKFKELDQ